MSGISSAIPPLITGLFVIILVALGTKTAKQRVKRLQAHGVPGEVQRQLSVPKWVYTIIGIIFTLSGVLIVAVSFVPQDDGGSMLGPFFLGIVMLLTGIVFLVIAYFLWKYKVIVTPESITVFNPFRGTQTVTHHNLISAEPKATSMGLFVFLTYRNVGDIEPTKLRIAIPIFNLTVFFEGDPKWASVLYSLQNPFSLTMHSSNAPRNGNIA